MEDILEHAHEYKGEQFLTFEVARLQKPDSFGNGYTVYVNKLVETEDKPAKAAPKTAAPKEKTRKKTREQPYINPETGDASFPF